MADIENDQTENSIEDYDNEFETLSDISVDYENVEGKENIIETVFSEIEDEEDDESSEDYVRPEVLLAKLNKKLRFSSDFNTSKVNAVKCVALTKIIYGESHWKVAEAHINLSNVYLKGKYFPLQAIKHSKVARDRLLFIQKTKELNEICDFDYLLLNLYYVIGCANLQNNKNKVAENCLQKAKLVGDNTSNATKKYVALKVLVLSSLAKVVSKLGQLGQAINYIEEAQEINDKMTDKDLSMEIRLYLQALNIELLNKQHANFASAFETCEKAIKVASELKGDVSVEVAQIYDLKCRFELQKEHPDYAFVIDILYKVINIYDSLEEKYPSIDSRHTLCKVLLQQNKASDAKPILLQCIEDCELLKGEMSLKSAELYELMGSILYSQKKIQRALIYFTKAEDIYRGKKKHKLKQEKISKLIEMIRKGAKDDRLKTGEQKLKNRPRFN